MKPTNDTPKRRGNPNFGKKPEDTGLDDSNKQAQVPTEPTNADLIRMVNQLMDDKTARDKEIEALKKSVDQNAYNAAILGQKKDDRPQIKLRKLGDKIFASWSDMIHDDVYVKNGEIKENQICRITFLDGTTEEMPYVRAFNHQERTAWLPVVAKIIKDGKNYYTVVIDGEEHTVEETFINA